MDFFYMYGVTGEFKKVFLETFESEDDKLKKKIAAEMAADKAKATAPPVQSKEDKIREEMAKKQITSEFSESLEANKPPPKPETEEEKRNKKKLVNMNSSNELGKKYGRTFTVLEVQNTINFVKDAAKKAMERMVVAEKLLMFMKLNKMKAENMAMANRIKYKIELAKASMNGPGATISNTKERDKEENLKLLALAKMVSEKVEPLIREAEAIMSDAIVVKYSPEVEAFSNFCKKAFNTPDVSEKSIESEMEKARKEADPDLQYIDESTYKYYYLATYSLARDVKFIRENMVNGRKQIDDFNEKYDSDVSRISNYYL